MLLWCRLLWHMLLWRRLLSGGKEPRRKPGAGTCQQLGSDRREQQLQAKEAEDKDAAMYVEEEAKPSPTKLPATKRKPPYAEENRAEDSPRKWG